MKAFVIGGAPTKEFQVRIQLILIDKPSCAFSSSSLFCQKSFFAWNYKFLQILMNTEKTRETAINVWYLIYVEYFFYRQQGLY